MPPLSIMVKPVSGACNMRCGYCFYRDVSGRREEKDLGRMTRDTLRRLVKSAFAYADGGISFAFQGGEPTLAGLAFFEEFIRLVRQFNTRFLEVSCSIQTNGLDISDDMIAFFAREKFLIGVSLDGCRATHDRMRVDAFHAPTYDRIRANIRRMQDAGCMVNVLCVVDAFVAREPEKTWEALKDYEYLQFIPCLDDLDGGTREYSLTWEAYARFLTDTFRLYRKSYFSGRPVSVRNFDNYLRILLGQEPENCAMRGECGVYYLVEADGSVYPCDFYVLDEYRMGNVNDASFHRLALSPVGETFRAPSRELPETCRACPYVFLCRNGCRRERICMNGGDAALNRFCLAYKAFFDRCLPDMRKMAMSVSAEYR